MSRLARGAARKVRRIAWWHAIRRRSGVWGKCQPSGVFTVAERSIVVRILGSVVVVFVVVPGFAQIFLDHIIDRVDADADLPLLDRAFPRGLDLGQHRFGRVGGADANEVEILKAVLGRGQIGMGGAPDLATAGGGGKTPGLNAKQRKFLDRKSVGQGKRVSDR